MLDGPEYPKEVDFTNLESVTQLIEAIIQDDRYRDVRHKMSTLCYIFLSTMVKVQRTDKVYKFLVYILGIFTGVFFSAYISLAQMGYLIAAVISLIISFIVMVMWPRGVVYEY